MTNEVIKYRVCDKCPARPEVLATETHKLALNGYRYELDLCDEHAAALYVTVMDWAQLGSAVGEPTMFDKPRDLRPAARTVQLPRPTKPAAPEPVHRGPVVADFADKWIIKEHARLRLVEREISEWDMLRAAELPDHTTASKTNPDLNVHFRGDIKVVVNPYSHEIITVARMNEDIIEPERAATGGR